MDDNKLEDSGFFSLLQIGRISKTRARYLYWIYPGESHDLVRDCLPHYWRNSLHFAIPLIKNAIQTLNAYLDAKGMSWSLSAAKQGKISVDRYMQLRDS
jgi:hypothetical protein